MIPMLSCLLFFPLSNASVRAKSLPTSPAWHARLMFGGGQMVMFDQSRSQSLSSLGAGEGELYILWWLSLKECWRQWFLSTDSSVWFLISSFCVRDWGRCVRAAMAQESGTGPHRWPYLASAQNGGRTCIHVCQGTCRTWSARFSSGFLRSRRRIPVRFCLQVVFFSCWPFAVLPRRDVTKHFAIELAQFTTRLAVALCSWLPGDR